MAQINLSINQKHTHRHRKQTCACQGEGVVVGRTTGSLGLVEVNYYM